MFINYLLKDRSIQQCPPPPQRALVGHLTTLWFWPCNWGLDSVAIESTACTGIALVSQRTWWVRIPFKPEIFFRLFFYQLLKLISLTAVVVIISLFHLYAVCIYDYLIYLFSIEDFVGKDKEFVIKWLTQQGLQQLIYFLKIHFVVLHCFCLYIPAAFNVATACRWWVAWFRYVCSFTLFLKT